MLLPDFQLIEFEDEDGELVVDIVRPGDVLFQDDEEK